MESNRCSSASILLSFIAIESIVNNMMTDFSLLGSDMFTVHELGFLKEKSVQFQNSGEHSGEFIITNRSEYRSLEDKILFLIKKIGGKPNVDKGSTLWQQFQQTKQIRDSLSHPREDTTQTPTPQDAKLALDTSKEVIKLIALRVWGQSIDF